MDENKDFDLDSIMDKLSFHLEDAIEIAVADHIESAVASAIEDTLPNALEGNYSMAKHEFGVMEAPPIIGTRYDEYEPEKYNCISVDDIYLENILDLFESIDTFCHTTSIKSKGLMYTGITLIPPLSAKEFANRLTKTDGLIELKELFEKAYRKNKFVIHYGL